MRVTQGPSCRPAAMAQPLRAGPAHHLAALPCSLGATTCHFLCPQEGHPPGPHSGEIFFEGEGEGSFLLPKSPSCLPVSPQTLPVGPGSCPSAQGLPEVGKPELKRACSLPCHLSPPAWRGGIRRGREPERGDAPTRFHAQVHALMHDAQLRTGSGSPPASLAAPAPVLWGFCHTSWVLFLWHVLAPSDGEGLFTHGYGTWRCSCLCPVFCGAFAFFLVNLKGLLFSSQGGLGRVGAGVGRGG